MNSLPLDLENIITEFKVQLEMVEQMNKSINEIKNITYQLNGKRSCIIYKDKKMFYDGTERNRLSSITNTPTSYTKDFIYNDFDTLEEGCYHYCSHQIIF